MEVGAKLWIGIGVVTVASIGAALLLNTPIIPVALAVFAETALLSGTNRILLAFYETHTLQVKEYYRYGLIANLLLIALLFIVLFAIGILNLITASVIAIGALGLSIYFLTGYLKTRHYTYEVIA